MRIYLLLSFVVLTAASLAAEVHTNQSVITMVKAGLAEDVVVLAIEQGEPDFDLTAPALVDLKREGVPDAVLKAMIARQTKPERSAAPPEKRDGAQESAPAWEGEAVVIDLPPEITPKVGETYYTRFSFHYERGRYLTTNYARGTLLPLNTKVRLLSIEDDELELQVAESGEKIDIENVRKYSGEDISGIAKRMLAAKATDLEPFDDETESAIQSGTLRMGMTKQQVILARGYPPAHETASTESDRWVYWSSRFVKHTLVFKDNRLVEGRGIL